MRIPQQLVSFVFIALPAFPCTCVFAVDSTARDYLSTASVVFRGTVTQRETFPQRVEMKGRGRYAITFRVNEYWKGSPGRRVTLYGMDGRADCMGGGGYQVGKNYLVFAGQGKAKDIILENGFFWYGWADVLPEGTTMLVPQLACTPGGETSAAKQAIRELGRGRAPDKRN